MRCKFVIQFIQLFSVFHLSSEIQPNTINFIEDTLYNNPQLNTNCVKNEELS